MEKVFGFDEKFMNGFSVELAEDKISFNSSDLCYFEHVVKNAYFKNRRNNDVYCGAEDDPSFKQIIPYICYYNVDKHKYITYRRNNGGEKRLNNKFSIGIGGHINPEDFNKFGISDPILSCCIREIREEFGFSHIDGIIIPHNTYGVIYDDSNSVGKVHFGVLFINMIKNEDYENILHQKQEDSVADICLMSKSELKEKENLENWSRLVIERI